MNYNKDNKGSYSHKKSKCNVYGWWVVALYMKSNNIVKTEARKSSICISNF